MSGQNSDGLDFTLEGAALPSPAGRGAGGEGAASPIADLSYRNYDGPLLTRRARWCIVALNSLRLAKQKKGFWIAAAISIIPYLFVLIQLYTQSISPAAERVNPFNMSLPGQKYSSNFFQALDGQAFLLFIIALMVGSGSVALDNRSNALLVYLSKPITKGDYLLGKWMGVFLTLFTVAFVPSLLLYLYCLLSYAGDGFFRQEPWLFVRMMGACAVPAAVHASLVIGFSAWSKTPRMAGAIYAGVYFVGLFVAMATWGIMTHGNFSKGILVRHLSVPGVISGLEQTVLNVKVVMPTWNQGTGMPDILQIPPPPLQAMVLVAAGLCLAGVAAGRARIRAVEVVKG
jgi:ABC-2 type transport system permease protein